MYAHNSCLFFYFRPAVHFGREDIYNTVRKSLLCVQKTYAGALFFFFYFSIHFGQGPKTPILQFAFRYIIHKNKSSTLTVTTFNKRRPSQLLSRQRPSSFVGPATATKQQQNNTTTTINQYSTVESITKQQLSILLARRYNTPTIQPLPLHRLRASRASNN